MGIQILKVDRNLPYSVNRNYRYYRTRNRDPAQKIFSSKGGRKGPNEMEYWSLTTLQEKLVKIGAKVVHHGRYVTFQLAEVAVPWELFRKILSLIDDLRRKPAPA